MTTRLKGFVVMFEKDIREDVAEAIRQAIMCLRGVLDVKPVEANSDDWMNRQRVRMEFRQKIFDVLRDDGD